MIIFGYICALVVGLIVGLLGAGGAILAVPVLVYVFHVQPTLATTYSLFIVGLAATAGLYVYAQKGLVEWRTGWPFAIQTLSAVFFIRFFIWPRIPEQIGPQQIEKSLLVMIVFAIVMMLSAYGMLGKKKVDTGHKRSQLEIAMKAIGVGSVTGFLGGGGGFIAVPALHFLLRLEMKRAVATSLMIIALNSFFGFILDLTHDVTLEWIFLFKFSAMAILGVYLGFHLNHRVSEKRLKKTFGVFLIIIALIILFRELKPYFQNWI